MKLVPMNVTRSISRQILVAKKNSPHIFFVGGVAGVIGSTVLACRATLKLEKTVDEIKRDLQDAKVLKESAANGESPYTEQDYYRYLLRTHAKSVAKFGKLYGPSVALGTVSIAALTGSHIQLTRRNAALSATLAAVSKAYEDYRVRVQEEIGEERELELYRCMEDAELEDGGKKKKVKQLGDPNKFSVYARVFDESNPNWEKNAELNRIFIQCQQNYLNHQLQARGHVFLNEAYDHLGFERSQAGQVVGWVRDGDGDGFIDFNLFVAPNNRFVNGEERSIWLDFNVDGVVYDKI